MKLRRLTPAASAVALILPMVAPAQLTDEETEAFVRALNLSNMTLGDLGFEKRIFDDPYRLPFVDKALADPLGALADLGAIQESARTSPLSAAAAARTGWGVIMPAGPGGAPAVRHMVDMSEFEALPEPLRKPVKAAVEAILAGNTIIKEALGRLSPDERRDLLETLPRLAADSENVEFSFVKRPALSREEALNLLQRVDMRRMRVASESVARELDLAVAGLKVAAAQVRGFTEVVALKVRGIRVLVGGTGDDAYSEYGAALIVDIGGNDQYSGRVGAGVMNCGALIDLSGNDQYDLDDLSGGAGVLGCGFLFDLGGHDRFFGKSITFGAGVAGFGLLRKEGGHDRYRSAALSQGFGFFGVGALIDERGDDRYDAGMFGQGAARTRGFGWLVDRSGDDSYYLGGIEISAPLFEDVWYGFGQGFAMGFREDTGGVSGGVGVLSDLSGDDSYRGGTYVQGASYWFSLGALMDDSGHDTYSAYHYAQASAMHLTAAYLVDLGGDDLYGVKYGACHAIGHDYGVAMLLDRSGNDVYAARDSTPGIGNANGVGLFLDAAGEDRYAGPPGKANPARGSGSIGLFVDMGGADRYRIGLADGGAAFAGTWGTALDMSAPAETEQTTAQVEQRPTPGSEPNPGREELETIYAKAIQWGVGTAQDEVRDNVNRLIGIGLPAAEWMLQEKLRTANRLSLRAFNAVIGAIGEPAENLVPPYIASPVGDEALNALRVCLTRRIAGAAPYLPVAIEAPKLRRTAIRVAGAIKAEETVGSLIAYAEGSDPVLSLAAVLALGEIGSVQAVPTFEKLLTAQELPVRKAALAALAKFPEQALAAANRLIQRPSFQTRVGIELLGAVGSQQALLLAAEFLRSPMPGARIEALRVLRGRVPEGFETAYDALLEDPDPDVSAVARWAAGGR
ncbi:MAG: HEAT repeat domain-containing protein [Armatimonadetes bacterium]|nr:HEAT repeat domain-containing protein [Armatimonadota bacterium]